MGRSSLGPQASVLAATVLFSVCLLNCKTDQHSPNKAQASASASSSVQRITLPRELAAVDGTELLKLIKTSPKQGVLINVWATWCGSCKAEMPMLLKLRKEYEQRGIELFFVSVDDPRDVQKVVEFLKQQHAPLPSLLVRGELEPFKQTMSTQWKGSLPATFLFDKTGKLRYFWGAQVFESELRPVLDGFLEGEAIDGAANFMIRRGSPSPGQ